MTHAKGRMRAGLASLAIILLAAGCTTAGTGIGSSPSGALSASFAWTADSPRSGTMTAMLSNGAAYRGPFFQVTRETRIDDLSPLWVGWGGRWRWHGWDYWGPRQTYMIEYSGKVLANLEGPGGRMRCRFTLMRPAAGMAGGGQGRCQLPGGPIIDANFPPS
jgi:hypothetical protein